MPAARRRLAPAVIIAGVAGSTALALTMTGTMSAFAASITNSANSATNGVLAMRETDSTGKVVCNSTDNNSSNAASCATINKYGTASLAPGGAGNQTTISITNTGNITPKTFNVNPGACTQTGSNTVGATAANDLCAHVRVQLYVGGDTTGYPIMRDGNNNPTPLPLNKVGGGTLPITMAPGATQQFTFVITLDNTVDNTYEGLVANQTITWAFSS